MSLGRLLILDDEADVAQTVAFIAEDLDYECRVTTTAAEFFAHCEDWAPTHIALDLMMPDMDGMQVIHALAERRSTARLIITSGIGSRVLDAARRTAVERGLSIAGVLPKPFAAETLRAFLREAPAPSGAPRRSVPARPPVAEPAEEELRDGIERGELVLAYQPKVHCGDGGLAGFEALVRWSRAGTLVFPDTFIPLAERTGLIEPMTDVIFRDAVAWTARHFPRTDVAMSVNISARSLVAMDLGDRLLAHCRRAGLSPERVILEVTESSAMEDPLASLELLTRLRVRGFRLSIDDFGTGFSSMLQLVRLPFSEIKVDRSFVMHLTASQESQAVVRSIVDLGHSLQLRATAEGVEDAGALEFLRDVGCDLAQGYHIAKPMLGDAALEWTVGRGVAVER